MTQDSSAERGSNGSGWLEASGLLYIFRALGMAVHPTKLCFALGAIVLTFLLGVVLDVVWKSSVGGVEKTAILHFIHPPEVEQPEAKSDHGIFEIWVRHQRRCVLGLLGSSIPGASVAEGTTVGRYVDAHAQNKPLRYLTEMVHGVQWLLRYHPVYFLIFGLGTLLIWSFGGGAICRIAAVQFARDEKLTFKQAWGYAREKLVNGFFLAPCIPLIFIAMTAVLLVVGGMVLWIPVLGDFISGAAFGLAILGGFVITILLVGLLVGGSLLWPAVAVEGSDAFDSFSRSLSYPFTKPWKTIWYAVVAVVFAAICWLFIKLFTFFMLTITWVAVNFGTSPFGWWGRGADGEMASKLERLWTLGTPTTLFLSPDWSKLAWYEYISAALIAFHVLLIVGLMWSFLASFYFSASTVVYYLLRRDVDATDLEDVFVEEDRESEVAGAPAASASTPERSAAESPPEVSAGVSKGDSVPDSTEKTTPAAESPSTEESKSSTEGKESDRQS